MRCCRALAVITVLVTAGCQRGVRQPEAGPDVVSATTADTLGPGPSAPMTAPERKATAPRAPASQAAPDPPRAVELVTIKLLVEPPKRAHVFWGVKDLGVAPLELRRPRGSGPMDLALRAPGFLTHHTRVFTDRDDTLFVRLGPETEAARYFGYQAPSEKNGPETKAKPGVTPGAKPNPKDNRGR